MSRSRRITFTAIGVIAAAAAALTVPAPSQARDTVTMWGNAYAFIFAGNHARLEGAKIRIAEYPELQTTAGPNGAYRLEVPDNATITPYVEFPGYYPTYVQTFHTQGQNLRHVNFQVPELPIYRALAGVVGAKIDPETGLLAKCAIVSTFYQLEGRTLRNFDDFHDFRPHGVPGSTAAIAPGAGRQYYFNSDVIPDPDQHESSRDGGVLWADVDTGKYQITGANPDTRFASFVATCTPGRLVNANPPWGLYQMADNEVTNPATLPDRRVDARLVTAKVKRVAAGRRELRTKLKASEDITVSVTAKQRRGHDRGYRKQSWQFDFQPVKRVVSRAIAQRFQSGPMKVKTTFTDVSGNLTSRTVWLSVPAR